MVFSIPILGKKMPSFPLDYVIITYLMTCAYVFFTVKNFGGMILYFSHMRGKNEPKNYARIIISEKFFFPLIHITF